MHQFDNPLVMTEEGHLLPDKLLRLNEILQDMQMGLELLWIPPQNRNSASSRPYCVCQILPDKRPYVIMFIGEQDDPVDILARIWAGDTRKNDVLSAVAAKEAAEKAFQLRAQADEMEEAADLVHFLATNRSPWYSKIRKPDDSIVKIETQHGRRVQ